MKYKPEIGKIYDTLFFCVEYFNEKAVKDVITNQFTDTSFMTECYDDIVKDIPSLPPILKPLFFFHNQNSTVMTTFFTEIIDYENDTMDSFLQKMTEKADIIYSKALSSLFSDSLDETNDSLTPLIAPASYIEALSTSEYPEEFKLQISLLFGNFNYVISLLVEQLGLIFKTVNDIHIKHEDKVIIARNNIQSERNLQLYEQSLSLKTSEQLSNCFFTISLLNQYITQPKESHGIACLLLGFNHEEELSLRFREQNINMHQLLISIGNETRLSILDALIEKRELTATTIAKIIQTPLTTVLRHIEILYESGVLFISKRRGLQVFYRLNHDLLSKAIKLFSNKIGGSNDGQQESQKRTEQMD